MTESVDGRQIAGAVTPDGSPVDLYRALPPDRESALRVHEAVPEGCAILELGAGTGRITHPLLELGHPVVAVDESADMLGYISGAETVLSKIEDLNLGRGFPAVLLMSFLVAYRDRAELLDSCRRHVVTGGAVIIERETPDWFDNARPRRWERDGIRYDMGDIVRITPSKMRATIEYSIGDRSWRHTFTSIRLGDEDLPGVLADAGLRLERFLDDSRSWILARPV